VLRKGEKPLTLAQVGSSVIAAWADISSAWAVAKPALDQTTGYELIGGKPIVTIGGINVGYLWMAMNCFASAAYVSDASSLLLIQRRVLSS
jgi:hypothetical protein